MNGAQGGTRGGGVLGEPWSYALKPFGGVGLFDCENKMFGSVEREAVAARIVDCVNSLAPKAVRL